MVSEPTTTNPEVTFRIPTSTPIIYEFFQYFSVPSPTSTISTPITIAPCPPVCLGVSQAQTPLFTDSTATTTTSTVEPPVTINSSDAGAIASGFIVVDSTPLISPLSQDDPYIDYGGDDEDFGGFTNIPFNIWTESDDEASVMCNLKVCTLQL